jgi:ABC-type branched-subunit amino acid transport system substrate-binding protein
MRRSRGLFAVLVAAVLLAAACGGRDDNGGSADESSSTTAGGSSETTEPTEPTEATEIGITADEIHIGVVADVDTPIAPGLSRPLKVAVEAWADSVNERGGIAGREVVVTFYDSKLNPDEATNAYTQACQNEFATIGSGAFALLNPDPIQTCADRSGNAIGLPDLAALAVASGPATSASTYAAVNTGQDFSAPEETWVIAGYSWSYSETMLGDGVTPKVLGIDPGVPGIGPLFRAINAAAARERGWEDAGVVTYPDGATQAEATPIIQRIKSEGINVVQSASVAIAKLMAEARVQGLDMDSIAWVCTSQCMNPTFASQNADSVEGLIISESLTPFNETDVEAVAEYRSLVSDEDVSANGLTAYGVGLAFEDIVGRIVEAGGVNSLTRQALLDALASGEPANSGGVFDESNVLGKPATCWNTVQVQDGDFVRVNPEEPGTFNCDDSVIVTISGSFSG